MPFRKRYHCLADVMQNTTKKQDCFEWNGAVDSYGYACCNAYGLFKSQKLHREVFRLHNGFLPEVVMHSCDNRKCINPAHLLPGTNAANIKDMDEKKRRASGYRNGNAKFSDEQVLAMQQKRKNGTPIKAVCSEFGVSAGYLWKLLKGQYRSAVHGNN